MNKGVKLISGNANQKLAEEISQKMKVPLSDVTINSFADGETFVKINENIRGYDVFVIQPTCRPVNSNLVELLVILDALKRASAQRVTVVMPYYGYARQDRKDQARVPITARLMANVIETAGADRVLAMDLHADQIQGFFNKPLDHLYAAPVFIEYLKKTYEDMIVVAPDVGAIKMARSFAKKLGVDLAVVDKRRLNSVDAEVMNVLGDVKGRLAVIVDDMVATAGSLVGAAKAVHEKGAKEVVAAITHPVLVGPAFERIQNSCISKVIVSNSIQVPEEGLLEKIKVLSVGGLLAAGIQRIHDNESISSLFKWDAVHI
ncbi:phosphoribosylpyrophosphate synthetase [PVC group bacterium (ex Bugula neritina AB1)]|nr:phosphoribosylpyrophosphate synthetase [PVC group bacterium (ex Bugula neritina AB1)]